MALSVCCNVGRHNYRLPLKSITSVWCHVFNNLKGGGAQRQLWTYCSLVDTSISNECSHVLYGRQIHSECSKLLHMTSNVQVQDSAAHNMSVSYLEEGSHRREDFYRKLLQSFAGEDTYLSVENIIKAIEGTGISEHDGRLTKTIEGLTQINTSKGKHENIDDFIKKLSSTVKDIRWLERVLNGKLIIPEFEDFKKEIDQMYKICCDEVDGENVDYIPALEKANAHFWGVSVCTVDGQRHSVGDTDIMFSMQSGFKCFAYALAVRDHRRDVIHRKIGMEPSGTPFNKLALSDKGKPHNPMINSGALALCSMMKPALELKDRLKYVLNKFKEIGGASEDFTHDNDVFNSEQKTADMNMALIHYMKHKKIISASCKTLDLLEFYTKLCSTQINCSLGAVMSATLANGGICPITDKKVLSRDSVHDTLAIMQSCGMYDHSGEFAFYVGLPAKSGVSGVIFLVVPNVMGLCMFSPPLDEHGHSVRGLHFCKEFVKKFNFHNCDAVDFRRTNIKLKKTDPRRKATEQKSVEMTGLMFAAKAGSLSSMKRYSMMSWVDLNQCDYDGRTPLHIAASEGHYDIVDFLVNDVKVYKSPRDRWSRTPYDDAVTFKHKHIAKLLQNELK